MIGAACRGPILSLCLLAGVATAAPPGASAQAGAKAQREIEQLIAALGASGCRFERNGSWHSAEEAQAHLRRKYAYLRKRDLAGTAEQFIERAGSRSSLSGRAYRVRCGETPATSSAQWLRERLAGLRKAPNATPSP